MTPSCTGTAVAGPSFGTGAAVDNVAVMAPNGEKRRMRYVVPACADQLSADGARSVEGQLTGVHAPHEPAKTAAPYGSVAWRVHASSAAA